MQFLDRFASPLAVRPKEASDSDFTIEGVMLWPDMHFSLRSQCKRCSAGCLHNCLPYGSRSSQSCSTRPSPRIDDRMLPARHGFEPTFELHPPWRAPHLHQFCIGLLRPKLSGQWKLPMVFYTIGDVMPLTASAHVVACATTQLLQHKLELDYTYSQIFIYTHGQPNRGKPSLMLPWRSRIANEIFMHVQVVFVYLQVVFRILHKTCKYFQFYLQNSWTLFSIF